MEIRTIFNRLHACADPESVAGEGPTLTTLFLDKGKEDPNSTKSEPPSARGV